MLEARGDEPPLAAVERALAGEEPVAQDGPGGLEQPALVEGAGVRDQHLRGEIRVAHGVDALQPQAERREVPAAGV